MSHPEMYRLGQSVDHLKWAKTTIDVFGKDPTDVHPIYIKFAKILHPDLYESDEAKELATEGFKILGKFLTEAEEQIKNGRYGVSILLSLSTKKHTYDVDMKLAEGDIADIYHTIVDKTEKGIFKVSRSPKDNEFLENESATLKLLDDANYPEDIRNYVSRLVESFPYKDGGITRRVNVLKSYDGLISLEDLKDKLKGKDLDPRHIAWIWRRLLIALDYAHSHGIVHGAVLPTHVLIQPEEHGMVLVDWCYSIKDGGTISAISPNYRDWYPPEILKKSPTAFSTDLYMGAECMLYLLDHTAPRPLTNFFKGCMLQNPVLRPNNAYKLREEFTEVIENLWGKRKFLKLEI